MADFDPEVPSLGEIPLIEPALIQWPRLLSILQGLIQPPALLSSIGAFPTSIQLPALSTLPALGMEMVRHWIDFAQERLPFLGTHTPDKENGEAPDYEYRSQRGPRRSVFERPFDLGGGLLGEPLTPDLQSKPIIHMGETANEVRERYQENPPESFLPSQGQPSAQETSTALPSPHNVFEPAPEPVYLNTAFAREPWETLHELPHALEPIAIGQPITVASNPTTISELAGLRSLLGSGGLQAAEHVNLSEQGIQASSLHTPSPNLSTEILARHGIPDLLAAHEPATPVEAATTVYRQMNLATAVGSELPGRGLVAGTENTPFEGSSLFHGVEARAGEIEGNAAALSQPIERRTSAPSTALAEGGTMLGDVLGRHEGVLPHLPQFELPEIVTHSASPLLQHAALETIPISSPGRAAEPAGAMSFLSTSARTITSPIEQGLAISRLAGSPSTRVSEVEARVESEARPSGQSMPIAALGTAAISQLGALAHTGELTHIEGLMEPRRLESQARTELPATNVTGRTGEAAAAESAPLQFLRQIPTVQGAPSIGTLLGQGLASPQPIAPPVAEPLRTAINAGERTMVPPALMEFAGLSGLAGLGQEFVHVGQPLASGPSVENLPGAWIAAEHVAGQPESTVEQHTPQGVLAPPHMELRRESHPQTTQVYDRAGAPMMTPWSSATNAPPFEGAPWPGMVAVEPEFATNEAPAGGEAAPAGSASSAGSEESPNASPNLGTLARQVYSILKNELRAERDRHHLYSR